MDFCTETKFPVMDIGTGTTEERRTVVPLLYEFAMYVQNVRYIRVENECQYLLSSITSIRII